MPMSKKVVQVSGKRKKAIARATIREGEGKIRINSQLLDTINNNFIKMKIMEPLMIAGDLSKKVNIDIKVKGGGWQGQAEASRLAIARGLVEWSKDGNLKRQFLDYDRHLLIADVRQVEPSKPNDSKARAKRQFSKR